MTPPGPRIVHLLLLAGWCVLLALCPWWLGLPLLLAAGAGALFYAHRSPRRSEVCRAATWGLPGLLFAVQRALGGDVLAWGAALLGALLGFSLIALLESLLPRSARRRAALPVSPEWREIALAPVGPPARIIELVPVVWSDATALRDPRGDGMQFQGISAEEGHYRFADGRVLEHAGTRGTFSPRGRWFAAGLPDGGGVVLLDRDRGKAHRLRGWELGGWDDGEGPWLAREVDGVPLPLHEALGQDRAHA